MACEVLKIYRGMLFLYNFFLITNVILYLVDKYV